LGDLFSWNGLCLFPQTGKGRQFSEELHVANKRLLPISTKFCRYHTFKRLIWLVFEFFKPGSRVSDSVRNTVDRTVCALPFHQRSDEYQAANDQTGDSNDRAKLTTIHQKPDQSHYPNQQYDATHKAIAGFFIETSVYPS
jgi:hypothetical protein